MDAKRILFISGSVGLGHAGRDVAIGRALRDINPAVEISWLAGDPAKRLIADAGESLLPETDELGDDSGAAESISGRFSSNVVNYGWAARDAWKRNVRTFKKVTEKYPFDLVVGDETYEITFTFAMRPEFKRLPFVMIYDFVGLDAATWNPLEHLRTYMANRIWSGGRKATPPVEDLTLMVGEPDDVPDRRFGFLLPNRREYAQRHYEFLGYVFPFEPEDLADRSGLRARLGYTEQPLFVCAIGGTSVGRDLLNLCGAAYGHVKERVPDARMILVRGPRLDPGVLDVPPGVEVRGYVPRLYEHLAAADVAIVQGGGTTTLELTALRRPFLYFPLENHFEQETVVGNRLARHKAGQRMSFSQTSPEGLADAAVALLGSEANWAADSERWGDTSCTADQQAALRTGLIRHASRLHGFFTPSPDIAHVEVANAKES